VRSHYEPNHHCRYGQHGQANHRRRCDAFIPDVILKVPNGVLVEHENLLQASGRVRVPPVKKTPGRWAKFQFSIVFSDVIV
jgi:hypothetical protein